MNDYGRGLRAVLRLFPERYRESHAEEIVTVLRDAQEQGPLRVPLMELVSLAVAGFGIRVRSSADADWWDEIRSGLLLGIRAFMFFVAVGSAMFLWTTAGRGASIYGGYGYSDVARVLFVVVLVPLIAAFVAQLYGRWRVSARLAAGSSLAVLAYVGYRMANDEFGVGFGVLAALVMSIATSALGMAGDRLNGGRVRFPFWGLAFLVAVSVPLALGVVELRLWRLARPIVAIGAALTLVAAGMAIAGKPRGLVVCGVLIVPGWLMAQGILYWGTWPGWVLEFTVWTAFFVVASGLVIAAAVKLAGRAVGAAAD